MIKNGTKEIIEAPPNHNRIVRPKSIQRTGVVNNYSNVSIRFLLTNFIPLSRKQPFSIFMALTGKIS